MPNKSFHKSSAASQQRVSKIRLRSFDGKRWQTISLSKKTCDCEQFLIGGRCEHMSALGIYRIKPFTPTVHPTFSQALSALVKSIRIRHIDEAVYWLVYLDTFKEKQHRFRTARRLLIGSAEDGHSIPVMEKVVSNFWKTCKLETDLLYLIADSVRICKLPNWWHPNGGGPDYIYHSLVGERKWLYRKWDHKLRTLEKEIASAIDCGDKAGAIGGVMSYGSLQKSERVGATKQAEFLLKLAESRKHSLAYRLCMVHLSAKSALSGDNNFICQAAWMLAGGVSPVAEKIERVTAKECSELLERAKKRWQNPRPIPRWCCDGLHSAGDDSRFMGVLPAMWAVCRAFQHYKRIDPADKWLPEFQCFEGLIIEAGNQAGETA